MLLSLLCCAEPAPLPPPKLVLCIESFEVMRGQMIRVHNFYYHKSSVIAPGPSSGQASGNPRLGSFITPSLASFSWPVEVWDLIEGWVTLLCCAAGCLLLGRQLWMSAPVAYTPTGEQDHSPAHPLARRPVSTPSSPPLCSSTFIKPANISLGLFHLPETSTPLLHFSSTPLTAVFNAPNFTGRVGGWALSQACSCWQMSGSGCVGIPLLTLPCAAWLRAALMDFVGGNLDELLHPERHVDPAHHHQGAFAQGDGAQQGEHASQPRVTPQVRASVGLLGCCGRTV